MLCPPLISDVFATQESALRSTRLPFSYVLQRHQGPWLRQLPGGAVPLWQNLRAFARACCASLPLPAAYQYPPARLSANETHLSVVVQNVLQPFFAPPQPLKARSLAFCWLDWNVA